MITHDKKTLLFHREIHKTRYNSTPILLEVSKLPLNGKGLDFLELNDWLQDSCIASIFQNILKNFVFQNGQTYFQEHPYFLLLVPIREHPLQIHHFPFGKALEFFHFLVVQI